MTKWKHKCDLEWMRARQEFLTATDVKELLPVTKTGRPRSIGSEQYLKVLSEKLVKLTESDCLSYGAAARGHILEPYAVERFNAIDEKEYEIMWHWDNVVVARPGGLRYSLAFSPDALNRIPPYEIRRDNIRIVEETSATTIGEVKCYSPEKHLVCGHTPKEKLEERWQLAVAMAVCPLIEHGYLIFYNPSMRLQMYVVEYDRSDLDDEIAMVLEVEKNWLEWIDRFPSLDSNSLQMGSNDDEQKIIAAIKEKEKFNPEDERSVL